MSTPTIETTADMKKFLIEQIGKVASGEVEPKKARAVCAIAQQVYNMSNLEMRAAHLSRKLEGREIEPVTLVKK